MVQIHYCPPLPLKVGKYETRVQPDLADHLRAVRKTFLELRPADDWRAELVDCGIVRDSVPTSRHEPYRVHSLGHSPSY